MRQARQAFETTPRIRGPAAPLALGCYGAFAIEERRPAPYDAREADDVKAVRYQAAVRAFTAADAASQALSCWPFAPVTGALATPCWHSRRCPATPARA